MTLASVVCAVAAACVIAGLTLRAYVNERNHDGLFVQSCDIFGYSQMAQAFREARKTGAKVDFSLHDDETRWLTAKFKESSFPVQDWDEVVTTHAYHYFPGTDKVGPQYPPGTGWILSWFPARKAVRSVDRATIGGVAVAGIALVLWCAWQGLAISSVATAGVAWAVLMLYGYLGPSSYSINVSLLPIFLGTFFAWLAGERGKGRAPAVSILAGLCAGLLLGLAVQTRLASIFLVPAAALLFLPGRIPALACFLAGVCGSGIAPVLLHNKEITGSFSGSTYNQGDQQQSLAAFSKNSVFYATRFAESLGWQLLGLFLVAVLVATVILASANGANATNSNAGTEWRAWLKERRGLILAPACAFGLTLAYFLTHTVMIHYYLIPGMLQTCLLLAFLIFSMEMRWQKTDGGSRPRAITCGIFAVAAEMAVIAGVALAHPTVQESARDAFTQAGTPVPTLEVPAPLLEKNAWIWGGEYSSSIVYYTGHPAFKIGFSSPEIRKQIYEWVKVKGDAQYMEMETGNAGTADMSGIFAEAQALGWRFSPVGTLRNATCYKMEKP